MYFDRIAVFEVLYHGTSVKGGAHMRIVYEVRMSPALNGSSAIRRFKHSDAIEIRDGITFDFYTGLPHICGSPV